MDSSEREFLLEKIADLKRYRDNLAGDAIEHAGIALYYIDQEKYGKARDELEALIYGLRVDYREND